MEQIITINDWYDTPLLGLAYYNNAVCVYERIFDKTEDDWTDEYYLTPINTVLQKEILNQWHEWCKSVKDNNLSDYYDSYNKNNTIKIAIEKSASKRKYRKKAKFYGKIGAGYIPINYYVEWI